MFANNYRDHIAVLKERDARPSFDRVSALLAAHDAGIAVGLNTRRYIWVLGASGLVLLTLWMLPVSHVVPPRIGLTANGVSVGTGVTQGTVSGRVHTSDFPQPSLARHAFFEAPQEQAVSSAELSTPAQTIVTPETTEVAIAPVCLLALPLALPEPHPECAPIPIIQPVESNPNRLFLVLGGSLTQELGPQSEYRVLSATDVSVGGGYEISPNLSVAIMAAGERFVVNRKNYSTVFHNATFIHNGVSYSNVIGEIVISPVPFATEMYSIVGTVRFALGDSFASPFAEVLGGGSTEGGIVGASLGMSLFRTGNVSFDGELFVRSLIPSFGGTLTKIGASGQLRYQW